MAKKDIHCPFCRNLLEVNTEWAAMQLTCPHCRKSFVFRDRSRNEENIDDDVEISVKPTAPDPHLSGFPQMNNCLTPAVPANMFTALRKYAVFSGRASRKEFWLFSLFCSVIISVFCIASAATYFIIPVFTKLFSGLTVAAVLLLLLPYLAVMVRRCHDAGRPGYRILIALIPILGWLLLFYTLAKHSQEGDNAYGPNPNGSNKDAFWPVLPGVLYPLLVITALFVAMAKYVPVFDELKEKANRKICLSNLSRINKALEIYSRDNENQKYPKFRGEDGFDLLRESGLETADAFQCPSNKTMCYYYIGRGLEPRHRVYKVPVVICYAHTDNIIHILMADGTLAEITVETPGTSCSELLTQLHDKVEYHDENDEQAWKKVLRNARKLAEKRAAEHR